MGTESWEWGGMGTRKSFPHISTVLASIVVKNVFFCIKTCFLCLLFFVCFFSVRNILSRPKEQ